MPARMSFNADDLLIMNPFLPNFDILMFNSTSAVDIMRLIYSLVARKKSALDKPCVDSVRNLRGARICLVQPTTEGASQPTENDVNKILDVDGEKIFLSQPSFEVRIHSKFVQVFSFSEFYDKLIDGS